MRWIIVLAITAGCDPAFDHPVEFVSVCDALPYYDRTCPGDLANGVALRDALFVGLHADWDRYADGQDSITIETSGPCTHADWYGTMDPSHRQYVRTTANALGTCELRVLRYGSLLDSITFDVRAADRILLAPGFFGHEEAFTPPAGYDAAWQMHRDDASSVMLMQAAGTDMLTGQGVFFQDPDHHFQMWSPDTLAPDVNFGELGDYTITLLDDSGSPPVRVLLRTVP